MRRHTARTESTELSGFALTREVNAKTPPDLVRDQAVPRHRPVRLCDMPVRIMTVRRLYLFTAFAGVPALALGCREPAPVPDGESAAPVASAVERALPKPPLRRDAFHTTAPSALCSPVVTESCALDAVDRAPAAQVTAVKREGTVVLVGWAADGAGGMVPPVVGLELIGETKKFYAIASRVTKRPDVAAAWKVPAFVDSGYDAKTTFEEVEPGDYEVHVFQISASTNALTCNTRRNLTVE
jgi:hypothetical protein